MEGQGRNRGWPSLLAGGKTVDGGGDSPEVLVEIDHPENAGGTGGMACQPWDVVQAAKMALR